MHEDEDDADATAHNHALAAEIQGYLSQGKLHGRSVGHCEPRFQAPGSYEFLGLNELFGFVLPWVMVSALTKAGGSRLRAFSKHQSVCIF